MTEAEERLQRIEARLNCMIADCEREIADNREWARRVKRDYWEMREAGRDESQLYDLAIGFELAADSVEKKLIELKHLMD